MSLGRGFEQLEDRRMLAGVTMIAHGQNSDTDGWVTGMGDAIAERGNGLAQTPQYTFVMGCDAFDPSRPGTCREDGVVVDRVETDTRFGAPAWSAAASGEAIIKLDWSALTPSVLTGYPTADAVAHGVAAYLLENTVDGIFVPELPLHLIGHSRGASLITVLAERLGERGIWVDQATTLDPNNAVRILQNGDTQDRQATSYANVRFADNYWRRGGNGFPSGIETSGTHGVELDDSALGGGSGAPGYSSSHSNVHVWYHGTIDDTGAVDNGDLAPFVPPANWYAGLDAEGDPRGPRDAVGFHYSRLAGGARPADGLATMANRDPVSRIGSQWPNLDVPLVNNGPPQVPQGMAIPLQYRYQSVESVSIRFGYDDDQNPFNGQTQLAAIPKSATSDGNAFDNGLVDVQALPTDSVPAGEYFLYAAIVGQFHTRYVYAQARVTIIESGTGWVVNSTGDTGDLDLADDRCDTGETIAGGAPACTLRAALEQANATANTMMEPDRIAFAIPGAGVQAIHPQQPLPSVTEPVVIDGTTQPGYAGLPLIEVVGESAGAGASGLTVTSGGSTIRGLAINRFDASGIVLAGGGGNTVQQAMIGVDPTGMLAAGNGAHGVSVFGSGGNLLGGASSDLANVIAGNGVHGVYLAQVGSSNNRVQSNLIGLGVDGSTRLGNGAAGIRIDRGASHNRIGGPGNVISGNGGAGVFLDGTATRNNKVAGNKIGTDHSGLAARGNGTNGIVIQDATGNTIGEVGAGNLISGNLGGGLFVTGEDACNNLVQANLIGLDATGDAPLANGQNGVSVVNAADNRFGGAAIGTGNVISGNGLTGIFVFGPRSTNNSFEGNWIGTSRDGTAAIGNGQFGLVLREAPNNRVGGTIAGAGNLISGNSNAGIAVLNEDATGNTVVGNLIGTDGTGRQPLGNFETGVLIWKAPGNRIGGPTEAERNIVSGNHLFGIRIASAAAVGNAVQGNFIGTDVTGQQALPNRDSGIQIASAPGNTIGGAMAGAGNLISGNANHGVVLSGNGVAANAVLGNYVGVDVTGHAPLGNANAGIRVAGGAHHNLIGDSAAGAGNVISANGADGIVVADSPTTGNVIAGNFIGTNVTGEARLANTRNGISILHASANLVGGVSAAARNVISGNGQFGLTISGATATGNTVAGNFIGTDVTGTVDLGNAGAGVLLAAPQNLIGGTSAAESNLISGNDFVGVRVSGASASGNRIAGNWIGTQIDGVSPLGNTGQGVRIDDAGDTVVGGTEAAAGNVIAHQSSHGILVTGAVTGNALQGNSVFNNGGLGIDLGPGGRTANDVGTIGDEDADGGPNRLQNFPVLQTAELGEALRVRYTVPSAASNSAYPLTVEFFLADAGGGEGRTLLGRDVYLEDVATGERQVSFSAGGAGAGDWLVALATDAGGNTSEFSDAVVIAAALPATGTAEAEDLGSPSTAAGEAVRDRRQAADRTLDRLLAADELVLPARRAPLEDVINDLARLLPVQGGSAVENLTRRFVADIEPG